MNSDVMEHLLRGSNSKPKETVNKDSSSGQDGVAASCPAGLFPSALFDVDGSGG
jgi:hypothetical protein